MTLTVDMIDLSMLYYLTKACATADDTPSASFYTHVYATTTAQTSPPKSFSE